MKTHDHQALSSLHTIEEQKGLKRIPQLDSAVKSFPKEGRPDYKQKEDFIVSPERDYAAIISRTGASSEEDMSMNEITSFISEALLKLSSFVKDQPFSSIEASNNIDILIKKAVVVLLEQLHEKIKEKDTGHGKVMVTITFTRDISRDEKKLYIFQVGNNRVYYEGEPKNGRRVVTKLTDNRALGFSKEEMEKIDNVLKVEDLPPNLRLRWKMRKNPRRTIGDSNEKPKVKITSGKFNEGSRIFILSNGIHLNLTTNYIARVLENNPDHIDEVVSQMIGRALGVSKKPELTDRATKDDMTVIGLALN